MTGETTTTAEQEGGQALIRVDRGTPTADELAALTAVLLLRTAAAGADPDDVSRRERAAAQWSRPERESGFEGARTWQRQAR